VSDAVGVVSPAWLDLRERADASARDPALVDALRHQLPGGAPLVAHDLGCGSGAMTRWLAPQLAGPQHWVLHDRDATLLRLAAAVAVRSADGAAVTVETRLEDLTDFDAHDLAGASLVTASALLDVLTVEQVRRVVSVSTAAGCPALITLTVVGRVEFTPADPSDAALTCAFNAHQRRTVDGHRLLGPDAIAFTTAAFTHAGAAVLVRPSCWRLDASHQDLLGEWLAGWIDAACEQEPGLAPVARAYARRRAAELARGDLRVVVHHRDLLALPP